MKAKQLNEELTEIAKQLGINMRRDAGTFRSGYCIVNEQKLVLINRHAPREVVNSALARSISQQPIDDLYIKPAVREYIEREADLLATEKNFKLEIDY
jgi:hypothetical protein